MNEAIPTKDPIFTKSFNLNFVINFFVYLCMYLLIVVIAGYSKTEFHASDSLAGLVVGLFIVGSLIGRFITGKYVNSLGQKDTHFRINLFNHYSITLLHSGFSVVLDDSKIT